MTPRIGFACKYLDADQTQKKKLLEEKQRPFNTRGSTITWLNGQKQAVAEEKLWTLLHHNTKAVYNLIDYVGKLPEHQRMVRISSDVLSAFTHKDWRHFYQRQDVLDAAERGLREAGDLARERGVRLSFHPGQFVVLASDRPEVVESSMEEFEYHARMAEMMGYGRKFQDFKINVHISGKRGPKGFIETYHKLSEPARRMITVENDEVSWGLEDTLKCAAWVPVVLDIHHHWLHSGGYFIDPDRSEFQFVLESWRGVRPVIHYSNSREEYMADCNDEHLLPDLEQMYLDGHKKGKLRAHSDWYRNNSLNDWALEFLPYADIMCESKMKNLASKEFAEYAVMKGLRGNGSY